MRFADGVHLRVEEATRITPLLGHSLRGVGALQDSGDWGLKADGDHTLMWLIWWKQLRLPAERRKELGARADFLALRCSA